MTAVSNKPDKASPSIPRIVGTLESHTAALIAIKEAIEIRERRTKNILDSFLRVRELQELGIISVQGDQLVNEVGSTSSSDSSSSSGGGGISQADLDAAVAALEAEIAAVESEIVTDHGALTGLGDDDHTQYVLRSILTANGDLFARVAGVVDRIGIGSTGQVLTVSGGLPVWADPPDRSGTRWTMEVYVYDELSFPNSGLSDDAWTLKDYV